MVCVGFTVAEIESLLIDVTLVSIVTFAVSVMIEEVVCRLVKRLDTVF